MQSDDSGQVLGPGVDLGTVMSQRAAQRNQRMLARAQSAFALLQTIVAADGTKGPLSEGRCRELVRIAFATIDAFSAAADQLPPDPEPKRVR